MLHKNLMIIFTLLCIIFVLSSCAAIKSFIKDDIQPENRLAQIEQIVKQVRTIAGSEYKKLCLPMALQCIAAQKQECPAFDNCVSGLTKIDAWLSEAELLIVQAREALANNDVGKMLEIVPKIFKYIEMVKEDIANIRKLNSLSIQPVQPEEPPPLGQIACL